MTKRVVTNLALIAVIMFFGAPFLWMLASAFEGEPGRTMSWPCDPTYEHFRYLFDERDIGRALVNSAIVATFVMILGTTLAGLAGYGLSRLRSRYKTTVVYVLILLYAIPVAVTMIAIYDLADRLNLFDAYRGLVLVQTAIMLPFLLWLMKSFYDSVPGQIDEAAALDGAGPWRTWWEVLTPVVRPGIAITAGLAFMLSWAEVLIVLILISDADLATISLQFFFAADSGSDAQVTAALGLLYMAPVLLVFLLLRRLIVTRLEDVS